MRRAAAALVLASFVASASACACQSENTRPAGVPACDGSSRCTTLPPITGGGGAASDASLTDAPAGGTTSVMGTVNLFTSIGFAKTIRFGSVAGIRADGADGGEVTTTYDGASPFMIDGVRVDRENWFVTVPQVVGAYQAMPTLMPIDTTTASDVALVLIPGSLFDEVYRLLAMPTVRATGTAQAVLAFVRSADGSPVSGVHVAVDKAETVAYDAGGSFNDVVDATGPLGLTIIANVQALALPGTAHVVGISGSITTSFEVRLAADAATIETVALQL